MSNLNKHFQEIAGSPKPFSEKSLFGHRGESSYTSNTSALLQQLIDQVNSQNAEVQSLVGAITGKSGSGSAVENILGGNGFGGSALGGIAEAAKGGFSWQSILKDVFPIGGLISGIAGLFSSAPTPPPLDQYDAPPSLSFDAVLNSNGTLSQGSSDQYGHTRASSPGLDLVDAQGGPYSPYAHASNGSLLPVAGDPTTRYTGTLNLPELLQPLVQISPANQTAPTQNVPAGSSAVVTPSSPGLSSGSGSAAAADAVNQVPSFDQQWFNDHGSLIASAVRSQMLNYHPIVDTINDL